MRPSTRRRFATVAAVVMLATACAGETATAEPATEVLEEPAQRALPVDGTTVTMARAPWASEYLPAEILRQILTRLGYEVDSPGLNELDPDLAYRSIGDGSVDFWANSWYPIHFVWLEQELPDGAAVRDNVTIMGGGVRGAGIQGFLATRSWLEDNGVTSMDQINATPDLITQLDEHDAEPGNGIWNVPGCPVTWTCDDIIDSQFALYGWDNIEQVKDPDSSVDAPAQDDYDAMFDGFLALVNEDKPAAIYTWIPSGYVTRAVPGDNAKWLTMHPEQVIDDSNPLGVDGGESFDQRPGFTAMGDVSCTQPCQLGFASSDLVVTANRAFLDANPVLEAFLPLVSPDAFELQLLVVEQFNGDGSEAHVQELAQRWVEENGDQIDQWWAEAQLESG